MKLDLSHLAKILPESIPWRSKTKTVATQASYTMNNTCVIDTVVCGSDLDGGKQC